MQTKTFKQTVHGVLAGSYMAYTVLLLAGFVGHLFFPIKFAGQGGQILGFVFLLLAPLLISSAQRASRKFKSVHNEREVTAHDFMYGPYKYLQSPTHMGLFLMSLGFSFVLNSLVLVTATCIAYIVTHTIFLPVEQALLKKKYGAPYEAYLRHVRLSI